ncbi:MAG: type II secretion system protein [Candidatus Gracilibacteria bacterium]
MRKKSLKGFTLVELLVTIGIVALLSITALVGFVKIQEQFAFRSAVKGSANIIREVRSYALGNKTMQNGEVPYQYGAYIDVTKKKVTTFADKNNSGTKNKYDETTDEIFDSYPLDAQYLLDTFDETTQKGANMTLFYKPTTANFSILPASFTGRYVAIKVYDKDNTDRSNFIVLFNLSGNPETFDSLDEITQ